MGIELQGQALILFQSKRIKAEHQTQISFYDKNFPLAGVLKFYFPYLMFSEGPFSDRDIFIEGCEILLLKRVGGTASDLNFISAFDPEGSVEGVFKQVSHLDLECLANFKKTLDS